MVETSGSEAQIFALRDKGKISVIPFPCSVLRLTYIPQCYQGAPEQGC